VLDHLRIPHNNIAALHNIPAPQLIAAYKEAERRMGGNVPPDVGRPGFQPVVDGAVLPCHPFDPGAPAVSANVPFMVGSNRNEAAPSINNAVMEDITEEKLQAILAGKFPAKGKLLYETLRSVHPQAKPVALLSFVSAQNPMAYLMASRKAAQHAAPAYLYMFCYQTPVLDARPRAFHCSEIPFVFNNTERCETMTGGGEKAAALAGKMAAAWISFARTGHPGHPGLPLWPAFDNGKGATMLFNHSCAVVNDPDGDARALLERIYYNKEK
jgi:para-nitrobenzyl esterase